MARVKGKDTKPELKVRQLLWAAGYRYRLHRKDLPGSPDIVLRGRKAAVFVHGCFWHGHDCKRGARQPKGNAEYWRSKIEGNRARDDRSAEALAGKGWRPLVVWECELSDPAALKARLVEALG